MFGMPDLDGLFDNVRADLRIVFSAVAAAGIAAQPCLVL
jgi:hypothetical protein